MAKLRIYGDRISGNCLKVKWTADRLGLAYDWVGVSVAGGETRKRDFLLLNPAGQVPVVRLPDGKTLAQSNAIIAYLDDFHGGGLTPADAYNRARMFEWLFWEQYSHEPAIAVRRFQKAVLKKPDGDINPDLMRKGVSALGHLEGALRSSLYLLGDTLTLADIALVAYTRVAPEGGFDLDAFPAVQRWVARLERDLDIAREEGRLHVPV